MKSFFCFFFILISSYSQEREIIPENYIEFSQIPSNNKKFNRIQTDFDNDGLTDVITVIHNKTYDDFLTNKKFLLIHLSSQNENILIDFDIFYGVYFLTPKLKKNELEFQIYKIGVSGVYGDNIKLKYNKEYKKVELIAYEHSRKTTRGNRNMTYDLLTGKYNFDSDYFNDTSKKTEIEKLEGYKKQTNRIFTNDLFKQLIQVNK